VVKVAFEKDASSPLGERADLLVAHGGKLALAVSGKVDNIPTLQALREIVGNGTGDTRWVRVREEGATGDGQDAYAELGHGATRGIRKRGGRAIARLEAKNGIRIGEVHLPAALKTLRERNLPTQ
jgi:hypothetical protein